MRKSDLAILTQHYRNLNIPKTNSTRFVVRVKKSCRKMRINEPESIFSDKVFIRKSFPHRLMFPKVDHGRKLFWFIPLSWWAFTFDLEPPKPLGVFFLVADLTSFALYTATFQFYTKTNQQSTVQMVSWKDNAWSWKTPNPPRQRVRWFQSICINVFFSRSQTFTFCRLFTTVV